MTTKPTPSPMQDRRTFLGSLTGSALILCSTPGFSGPGKAVDSTSDGNGFFHKIKGTHRTVFDSVTVNEGHPVLYAHTFLESNNQTGTADEDLSVVVVLRNRAIPLAMHDDIWNKYKLGKLFKIIDPATNAPSIRNPYWDPGEDELLENGMSTRILLSRGVIFCVCEKAITVNSKTVARTIGRDPGEVKQAWIDGLLPGVELVTSGVWALNRAQEHGCSYCFAG